jgi:hypothetical protein
LGLLAIHWVWASKGRTQRWPSGLSDCSRHFSTALRFLFFLLFFILEKLVTLFEESGGGVFSIC